MRLHRELGKRVRNAGLGAGLAVSLLGCSGERRPGPIDPVRPAYVQTGPASWYGKSLAGRPTASGEPFDPRAMTAAHRTLPLGSIVRVTNVHNGRAVMVRINDRGPFVAGRVLDCSEAAAQALGFHGRGVAQVSIDWPEDAAPPLPEKPPGKSSRAGTRRR